MSYVCRLIFVGITWVLGSRICGIEKYTLCSIVKSLISIVFARVLVTLFLGSEKCETACKNKRILKLVLGFGHTEMFG